MGDLEDVMRDAVAAYAAGESMTAVAQRFEMSPGRLRRGIVAAGVAVRGTGVIPFDCDELRRLYIDEGLSTPAIAARTGLSVSGVGNAMRRCGIQARRAPTVDHVDDEQLRRLYVDEELDDADIARRFGVATWAVSRRRRAAGIVRDPSRKIRPGPPDSVLAARISAGATVAEIATEFEAPAATVRRWLAHAGVENPRARPATKAKRVNLDVEELRRLYVDEDLTAREVGARLGCSGRLVLRHLHDNAIPVRPPGARRPGARVLLEELRADPDVRTAFARAGIDIGGGADAEVPAELVAALYAGVGLSVSAIRLLTGIDDGGIVARLQLLGVPRRDGSRSPWDERRRVER